MAKDLEDILLKLLSTPGAAAAQADLAQAAALARQELSFHQRAGAAAARLRRAKADAADPAEIAALEVTLAQRTARLETATRQTDAANVKRPAPDKALAQVFGRATGAVEKPPLTLAAIGKSGEVAAQTVASKTGTFHLTAEGDLASITLQLSDAEGRVVFRSAEPVSVAAGSVLYFDATLDAPEPEPGPVPTRAKMPDLVGQGEGVAKALLDRLGATDIKISDKVADGQPGIVVDQSPKAGTALDDKSKITLTVRRAKGDEPDVIFMPGLIGSPLAEAKARLRTLGLSSSVKRKADDGPADIVLAQKPGEGTAIGDGDKLVLTVSQATDTAPETVIVPNLKEKSRDLAQQLLKATDLKASFSDTADTEAPAGVTAQDPEAGTVVKRKSTVQVTVNTPPETDPGKVIVPNLKGHDLRSALKLLKALQLEPDVETVTDAAPENQVIDQSPASGARVEKESGIDLTVSSGPKSDDGKQGDLTRLARDMELDPRMEDVGIDEDGVEARLRSGGVANLDGARALTELEPAEIRDRMKLRNLKTAASFRAILRKALKAFD